ncbi:MAG: hypothetical protein ACOX7J_06515 [Bacillota bacterium]
MIRLVVEMEPDLHKQMKIKACISGKSIKSYVIDLIAKDLKNCITKENE